MPGLTTAFAQGLLANRPAASAANAGFMYFATDSGVLAQSTGSAWVALGFANPMTTQDDLLLGGAAGAAARLGKGTDGQVLTVDPTTHHLVWATPASGGGAPTADRYLVQTADPSNLPNAVTVPGIAGWADKAGQLPPGVSSSGSPIAEEYETATTGLTWTTTPTVCDSNTTVKSALYIKCSSTTEQLGTRSWTPAGGAFDASWHMSIGADTTAGNVSVGPLISDSGNSNRIIIEFLPNTSANSCQTNSYKYAGGSYTQMKSVTIPFWPRYYRVARDGANNITTYISQDGLAWIAMTTFAFTLTVANIGYRVSTTAAGAPSYVVSDWLRTNI